MSDAAEILQSVQIGLNVVIFLLNTDRGPQATELCNECAILLQNLDCGSHLDISDAISNAYYVISGNTNAERYAKTLLYTLHHAGRLTIQLGDKYEAQHRFVEAKQLYNSAVIIMQTIGHKREEAMAHEGLGTVCISLSEMQKAKKHFQKTLTIAIEIGDRLAEGRSNRYLGDVFHYLCKYQRAKEYNEKALAIAIEIGDRKGEGTTYGNLGSVFHSLGEYQNAKEYYEKALAIAIEIGDKKLEGLNANLGDVCYSLGEYQKAKEHYQKALAIAKEICDRHREGRINGNLGNVFVYLGEYQKAKECYEKALAMAIKIGDRQGEGTSNRNLGNVFDNHGEYQKAKEYYKKALAIAIEIGDKEGEVSNNGSLGNVFRSLSKYQKAKEYYEKALAIAKEIGYRQEEGTEYMNLGTVFEYLGEYTKAKEYYQKALAIAKEIDDKETEGTINGNLGNVFYFFGEYTKAKEYYEEVRAIVGERKGEAYLNLGSVYFRLRENRKAKEYLDKAVGISIASRDRRIEAKATARLAGVFASAKDNQKAKEHWEKALTISRECGHRDVEASIYISLSNFYQSLGEYGKAEDCLEKAYSISSQIGYKMLEFESLLRIAQLKMWRSEIVEVKEYLLRCIAKYEQIRNFLKGNCEFKMALLEKHGTSPYRLLTDLLCNIQKFGDALYVEELGRARVLAEVMADKYSVESQISADPQSWFGIENIVRRECNSVFLYIAYRERQVLLWVLKANGDTCFRATDEVEVDTPTDEQVCDVEGIFKKSAASFGVSPTENCEDRSLDDHVTTSLLRESRTHLQGEQTKDTERIHNLCYKWIIAPVADLLTEPEIIFVPDRFSYRVPFAVLRDESAGKYLSEKYRIRIVPSLTTLRIIQECPADYHSISGALVVGDPTVGEVLYKGLLTDFEPLFCARKEAEMVGRLLGIQPLLGSGATKQAVLQAIPSVSLMHLAAHGNAERGEIALSPQRATNDTPQEEDYLLNVSEIQGVQVRAKLVVLSCCHSGRGLVKKEGVLGIARAFLASGARSVLVASWEIEDEATEQLMNHFYQHLVRGESASESLHQAVQWLRSNGFPKPSQWAPFVLMGDNVTFDFTKKG